MLSTSFSEGSVEDHTVFCQTSNKVSLRKTDQVDRAAVLRGDLTFLLDLINHPTRKTPPGIQVHLKHAKRNRQNYYSSRQAPHSFFSQNSCTSPPGYHGVAMSFPWSVLFFEFYYFAFCVTVLNIFQLLSGCF